MEHLSGLILLFIAKNCGLEVTTQKKMKMKGREKLKAIFVTRNTFWAEPQAPDTIEWRHSQCREDEIESHEPDQSLQSSQGPDPDETHVQDSCMKKVSLIHWSSGTIWPSVKKDYVWMTIMNCLWCLRKGTDHAKKVFRLHVSVKVAVLVHESQPLKHLHKMILVWTSIFLSFIFSPGTSCSWSYFLGTLCLHGHT